MEKDIKQGSDAKGRRWWVTGNARCERTCARRSLPAPSEPRLGRYLLHKCADLLLMAGIVAVALTACLLVLASILAVALGVSAFVTVIILESMQDVVLCLLVLCALTSM